MGAKLAHWGICLGEKPCQGARGGGGGKGWFTSLWLRATVCYSLCGEVADERVGEGNSDELKERPGEGGERRCGKKSSGKEGRKEEVGVGWGEENSSVVDGYFFRPPDQVCVRCGGVGSRLGGDELTEKR